MRAVGALRRRRTGLLVTGVALLAVILTALVAGRSESTTPLDPANPGPDGARAVARVLAERGVEVRAARGADELEQTPAGADTTIVVVGTEQLGPPTIDRMLAHAGAAELVLVEPGPALVSALGLPAETVRVKPEDALDAECGDPLVAGLEVEADVVTTYAGDGCFPAEGGAVLSRPASGMVLWGAAAVLRNGDVLRADNAAVALRLLGARDHLVWYVPDLRDLDGEEGVGLASLLPRWIGPGLLLLLLTVLALAWARGRRLGPLATEPLPVVVRAAETTESLGRLYRRAGDRGHAADVLRAATLDRVARVLRLGSAPAPVVARAVAARTGRPAADVTTLLEPGHLPADDDALITLANDLAALEEEVRRP
ncbi:MAG TPA: DUF4350 domain-containing protein [Nocardioides sp.]|uniref:DUF4350 domain-containing protein n=1 Tax=Nocardioides sp. TaxID=35761 RepID=UPI002ED7DE3D